MGGYDAVLGMDWLQQYRPMNCDWEAKWIEFPYMGTQVKLQGVLPVHQDHITEISIDQVLQLHNNNELWAIAVLEHNEEVTACPIRAAVQQLLQQFDSIFQNLLNYHHPEFLTMPSPYSLARLQSIPGPTGTHHCKRMRLSTKLLKC